MQIYMPSSERLTLFINGVKYIEHSAARPFAVALRQEKVYSAKRGLAKVRTTVKERIPLKHVALEGNVLVFSAKGHRLEARLVEREAGLELIFTGQEAFAYEMHLAALAGETVFGGGEQYRKTNLRYERVLNFVSEHIKASTIAQKAVLPSLLYREKPHSKIGSYAPMPIFTTNRGRLFFFDTSADGAADFGIDSYVFTYDSCPKRLVLLHADTYQALALELASIIPNRQYLPDWCADGMILGIQGGTDAILNKTFAMLDAGAKICGVWSQDWSGEKITAMGKQVLWNWEQDESLYPELKAAIETLNERGVRFLAYINPYLIKGGRLYDYCRDKAYLITHNDGSVYHIKSTTFDAGMLDLTNPEAVRYIKEVLIKKNMLDLGVSGWMADFGEYLPVDCVLHKGEPAELHNQWPVLWAKINREAIDEYGKTDAMFFTRSGYLGIQSYAPIMWNGDQHTDWTQDYGMPCVMPASFSLGFSGLSLVHSDIGGFFSFGKLKRDAELFIRWMEMGAFSPLMRSHEAIRPWANAQFDHQSVKPHTVRLSAVHAALKPYIAHIVEQAGRGLPAIRPDFWPSKPGTEMHDQYSYFLGGDMFIAPVITKGASTRSLWLPEGDWAYLWSGESFAGGQGYTVPAPLGRPPVFYRRDSAFSKLFNEIGGQAYE